MPIYVRGISDLAEACASAFLGWDYVRKLRICQPHSKSRTIDLIHQTVGFLCCYIYHSIEEIKNLGLRILPSNIALFGKFD